MSAGPFPSENLRSTRCSCSDSGFTGAGRSDRSDTSASCFDTSSIRWTTTSDRLRSSTLRAKCTEAGLADDLGASKSEKSLRATVPRADVAAVGHRERRVGRVFEELEEIAIHHHGQFRVFVDA